MASKQLESILDKLPAATVEGQKEVAIKQISSVNYTPNDEIEKLVARVPKTLKEEIRTYVKNHKGETEQSLILKGLKLIGFNVPNEFLRDKRTIRWERNSYK